MPTGIQQTIEGLLCGICTEVMNEPSYSNNDICQDCEDELIVYCAACGDSYLDRNNTTWEQRTSAIRLGIQVTSFVRGEDTLETICDDCAYHCPDCGETYQYEESMLDCCEQQSRNINNYSYRPMFIYHSINEVGDVHSTTRAIEGELYMGVELEINKMDDDMVQQFIDNCTTAEEVFVYFKEDGSLGPDGVELVTMPATLDAFEAVFPFDALDNARLNGARSFYYSNCGFHIHVSRSAFTPTHMWKFVRFQLMNPGLCQRVAQRQESSYATWYYDENEERDIPQYVKGVKTNGRRYLAINFQNHATVELRYFKGNILRSAILKNLEFVQSVYNYTKHMTVSEVMNKGLTENKYHCWLDENRDNYPHLVSFLDNDENEGDN